MGAGIARVFAGAENEVLFYDINEEYLNKGCLEIKNSLNKLVGKGKMAEGEKEAILSGITGTMDCKAAEYCDFVIEAITENMDAKKELFKRLDAICSPEAVLASNTSSLSITELAASTKKKDRVIGMHFFNPAPVMRLVEIIRGLETSDKTFERTKEIAVSIGKEAVEVKESPGFIVNRLLIPMINEAAAILSENISTAEDIDRAMVLGANHPMGPLALADLIGNDVNLAVMETLYKETGDPKYRPHQLLRKMVRAGYLGRKTGRGFYRY